MIVDCVDTKLELAEGDDAETSGSGSFGDEAKTIGAGTIGIVSREQRLTAPGRRHTASPN